ncbi:MAG: adaptor protein MecA [Lachnospiraceae bacterium]|nr:adaptor protein MecA [Lachnospiraceae bacterium]
MKYKKINEATVQCIISEEDMEEYGLTLADIFERNEKGEGFLRDIVERAHDEVGYKLSGDNIAMQITPLRDEGLVITFSDEGPAGFQHMLEHIKEVLTGMDPETVKEVVEDSRERENRAKAETLSQQDNHLAEGSNSGCRLFVFASIDCVLRYCITIPPKSALKSQLFKMDDAYYLALRKQRISQESFNKLSVKAVEFGTMASVSEESIFYLEEHAECLIADKAVSKLQKICLSN